MTQADLDALLLRFESGQATEADRQSLRQLLLANAQRANEPTIQQSGKYGVNVGEGKEIHIGDIIQGAGPELIRAIVQELLAFQTQLNDRGTGLTGKDLQDIPLELIEIEPQIIQKVNARITSVKELQKARTLTEHQQEKINLIKSEIQTIKNVEKSLKEIVRTANQLLQETIETLNSKLEELKSPQCDSNETIQSSICLDKQIEILQEFRKELKSGVKVAEWLDSKRSHLAEVLGQYALTDNLISVDAISTKRFEAFIFTIEQFLECLSHCLLWGDSSMLEAPEIPKAFDDKVYSSAFERLRQIIPKRFSDNGAEQLHEYLDCLLENLPYCPIFKIGD